MFAGAAGAVAAGGAAAYLKRDSITEGWSWIGSHLEFVGCLAKGEELKTRLDKIVALNRERGFGFTNLVTVLGKAAAPEQKDGMAVPGTMGFVEIGAVDGTAGPERTFCTLPKSEGNKGFFEKSRNDRARDETEAHMEMFERKRNPGYFALAERAKGLVAAWVEEEGDFYAGSEPLEGDVKEGMADGMAEGEGGDVLVMMDGVEEEEEEEGQGKDEGGLGVKVKKSNEFSDMEDVDLGLGPETDAWATGEEPVMVEK